MCSRDISYLIRSIDVRRLTYARLNPIPKIELNDLPLHYLSCKYFLLSYLRLVTTQLLAGVFFRLELFVGGLIPHELPAVALFPLGLFPLGLYLVTCGGIISIELFILGFHIVTYSGLISM